MCKPSTHNLPHHHHTINDAPTTIMHHPHHHNLSTTTMPASTHSNKPRNCSGLQRQAPAAEKRKHTESGVDKANKKPKVTTNEDADDIDDDSKVTGRGKKGSEGQGKGHQRCKVRCLTCHAMPCSRYLGKWLPTAPRMMLLLMQLGLQR